MREAATVRRILVTGVAGFIGSHLAERLVDDGHEVVGIDSFADHYPREVKEHNLTRLRASERFMFLEADLLNLDLDALVRDGRAPGGGPAGVRPEYIFHLAAQPGVRTSWGRGFDLYLRNNVLATQRLLESARGASLRKFIYASSSSIYGDAETLPTPEDITPRPISPYGVTKLAGEHLCNTYFRNSAVPVVCLRYFTVYGPRQREDMAFHRFILAGLQSQELVIFGDGNQTRDFTFVDDAVDGTVRAAFSDVAGQTFNIGGGSRASVNQVILILEELLVRALRRRYVDPERGDARHTAADIQRATVQLGYAPKYDLRGGLAAQVEWARQVMTARP